MIDCHKYHFSSFRNVRRYKLFLLTMVSSYLFSLPAISQENWQKFIHFNTSAGLSHNNILSVYQDKNDFLWVCTSDGLNRYDGREFVNCFHNDKDSHTLRSNAVYMVLEDKNGDLLVANSEGIDLINPLTLKSKNIFTPPVKGFTRNPGVGTICFDAGKKLWVGCSNMIFQLGDSFRILQSYTASDLGGKEIYGITPDTEGFVWVNCSGHLNKIDSKNHSVINFLNDKTGLDIYHQTVSSFKMDESGNYWAYLTNPNRLVRFSRQGNTIQSVMSSTDYLIRNVYLSGKSDVWISTLGGGLWKYDIVKNSFENFANNPLDPQSITSNVVNGVFKDRFENLWVYTENGLDVLPFKKTELRVWKQFSSIAGEDHEITTAMMQDGKIWVSGWGSGLILMNLENDKKQFFNCGPKNLDNFIWCTLEFNHEIWYGNFKGLHAFDPVKKTHRDFLDNPTYPVRKDSIAAFGFFKDKHHNVWISLLGDNGILRYDSASQTFRHFSIYKKGRDHFPFRHYDAITEDQNGTMWFGCNRSKGLVRWNAKEEIFETATYQNKSVFEEQVNCFLARGDNLWIGTNNGLYRMDLRNYSLKKFTRFEGLANNNVNTIVADRFNNIWVGTANGLSQLNPDGWFYNFKQLYDLPHDNIQYALSDEKTGLLYFLTADLVFSFNPEKLANTPANIRPIVTSVNIDGTIIHPAAGEKIEINQTDKIFSLEFTAPYFPSSDMVSFAYKLEGFDKNWQACTKQELASYTNLNYGTYEFHVKATTDGKNWFRTAVPLTIVIHAPFYVKPWFLSLMISGIIGIAILLFYFRYRIELSKVLFGQKIREKISQDIHDEISSGLTKISWMSESLKYKVQTRSEEDLVPVIDKIIVSTRETVSNLSDIIWSSNPENDSEEAFIVYLRNFVYSFLEDSTFTAKIDFPYDSIDRKMNPELIRNLFLIVKESLNNAVKYSGGDSIDVVYHTEGNFFILSVSDNGKGIKTEESRWGGNGMINMKKRAAQIKSELLISTNEKTGTTITVRGLLY